MESLSKSQIKQIAPSVFAKNPSQEVSDKYLFVSTMSILKKMEEYGWLPVQAEQSIALATKNEGVQRHMLKFEHPDFHNEKWGGNLQFIIINGHNARVSLRGYLGYHVKICSNGLVSGEIEDGFKIVHKRENLDFIKDALGGFFDKAHTKKSIIEKAHEIVLTKNERGVFAQKSHALRYKKDALVTPDKLLIARRPEDDNDTLWSVFNVLQENLIKGGVPYEMHNDRSTYIDISRPVGQIDKKIKINVGLWNMMQQYTGV